ncbi:MAG: hypothetical protein ACT4P6_18155 [Gemmatimonadaceae bacterium]
MTRRSRIAAFVALTLIVAAYLLVHICADGGAMGASYRTCRCHGIEWVLYDRIAADGPRRSACLGWISERTCYQSRGGPDVPCVAAAAGA